MGPFTLNALRTLFALPFFVLLFGRATTRDAWRLVRTEGGVWLLGGVWLVVCFVPYLASLAYLPPTITTLTVYLAPLLVAGWETLRWRERVSPLLLPTVAATFVGAALATHGPGGVLFDAPGRLGLGLAILGVVGWSGYTIQLKALTRRHESNALTLAAFLTSAVAFSLGSLVEERFAVAWSPEIALRLAVYVALPTVTSFWLYTRSLEATSASTVAVLIGAELVSTALISFLLTHEAFPATKILGLALTVLAVTAYLWDDARRVRRRATIDVDRR